MNKKIDYYTKLVNEGLSNIYKDGPKSLVIPISYVLSHPGKRIRPLLTLVVADIFSQNDIEEKLKAALAVEILHNFTLVHDDIMDNDTLRHGQPTVHEKWDNSTAILSGDALLSIALKKVSEVSINHSLIISSFINGLIAVCEGQALDKEFESANNINKLQYNRMIELKTGHLLGLSAELGAIIGGANTKDIIIMKEFGLLVGRAFQIQDDLLEIQSTNEKMGKTLGTDLLLMKKTYVLIECLEVDRHRTESILNLAKTDLYKSKHEIQTFIKEVGVEDKITDEINLIIENAKNLLLNVNGDCSLLKQFIEIIKNRKI